MTADRPVHTMRRASYITGGGAVGGIDILS